MQLPGVKSKGRKLFHSKMSCTRKRCNILLRYSVITKQRQAVGADQCQRSSQCVSRTRWSSSRSWRAGAWCCCLALWYVISFCYVFNVIGSMKQRKWCRMLRTSSVERPKRFASRLPTLTLLSRAKTSKVHLLCCETSPPIKPTSCKPEKRWLTSTWRIARISGCMQAATGACSLHRILFFRCTLLVKVCADFRELVDKQPSSQTCQLLGEAYMAIQEVKCRLLSV